MSELENGKIDLSDRALMRLREDHYSNDIPAALKVIQEAVLFLKETGRRPLAVIEALAIARRSVISDLPDTVDRKEAISAGMRGKRKFESGKQIATSIQWRDENYKNWEKNNFDDVDLGCAFDKALFDRAYRLACGFIDEMDFAAILSGTMRAMTENADFQWNTSFDDVAYLMEEYTDFDDGLFEVIEEAEETREKRKRA